MSFHLPKLPHLGGHHHHGAGAGAAAANGNGTSPTAAGAEKRLVHYTSSGREVINTNGANKFTAFTPDERDRLGVRGLVPPAVEDLAKQAERELRLVRMREKPIDRYMYLMQLHDRNQTLFYYLLMNNVEEMTPLVYTPTVGEACVRWSEITTHSRGLVITINDLGHVDHILGNWGIPDVRAIVVTDGERILGLGDQGYDGMGIPVGKLQLYTACGGIHPRQCLPVTLDVGTNNETKRSDPFYMGVRNARDRSQKYWDLVDEFMRQATARWPKCMIQFEDFGSSTAFPLLHKYRDSYRCFNDDISGTAAVSLAGVISSLRITAKAREGAKKLSDHTYVFLGAGEAGVGIAELIALAISEEDKIPIEKARAKIWLVDSTGLISSARPDKDKMAHHKLPFVHDLNAEIRAALGDNANGDGKPGDHANLANIVRGTRATALIGVSATPRTFTQQVVEQMAKNAERPVIFALSNPTSKCECTAEEAINWSKGRAIFATGSPFPNVKYGDREFRIGQANNMYVFNGIALGVLAVDMVTIPDSVLLESARALADQTTDADLESGSLFPPLSKIQNISANVAARVAQKGYELKLAKLQPKPDDLLAFCATRMYQPTYAVTTSGTAGL